MGSMQQFESLTASSLYCDKCKKAMPVRERLLLILPDKEIFDYLCTDCGASVGQREVTVGEKLMSAGSSGSPGGDRPGPVAGYGHNSACASFSSAPAKSVSRR